MPINTSSFILKSTSEEQNTFISHCSIKSLASHLGTALVTLFPQTQIIPEMNPVSIILWKVRTVADASEASLREKGDGDVHSNNGIQLLSAQCFHLWAWRETRTSAPPASSRSADELPPAPSGAHMGERGFDGWRSCFRRQSDIIRHSDSLFSRWQLLLCGTEGTGGGRGCSLRPYDYNRRHNSHCYHGVIKDD